MRYRALALTVIATTLVAGGCGGEANQVPDVEGKRLDIAQRTLDDAGLGYEVTGGGRLGAVPRKRWRVCEQRPRAGKRAENVQLIVARSCPARRNVPHLIGMALDDAKELLDERGLEYEVYNQGTGPIVVEGNWVVCDQWPYADEKGHSVELYAEHFCDDEYDEDDD
jgi:hypothetical protein